MDKYNESLSFDRVFYAQDIKGSIAYARANVTTGILTEQEFEKIEEGFKVIFQEWEEGKFEPKLGDEGRHFHINHVGYSGINAKSQTFTLQTNAGSARSSARTSRESCTLAAAATTRSPPTCACGSATS
jgi:hypothetical protein